MPIELNILESERFGVSVAHVVDPAATPKAIDAVAQKLGVQMVIVRIPANELTRVHAFEQSGYRLMDTLVYYSRGLENLLTVPAASDGVFLRLALPEDVGGVAEVARNSFVGYIGHYHADPKLDSAAADAAYVEWAETSTACASDTSPVIIARLESIPVGFLILRSNGPEEMEIVLNAVEPRHRGRGIYTALVGKALSLAKERGYRQLLSSTQINNYRVQGVWSRLGFAHSRSLYTLHKWF